MDKAKSGGPRTHKGALDDEAVESLNTGFSNLWLRFQDQCPGISIPLSGVTRGNCPNFSKPISQVRNQGILEGSLSVNPFSFETGFLRVKISF
jgi:hypothetical protein